LASTVFLLASTSSIFSRVHSPPSSLPSSAAKSWMFWVRMQPWLSARTSLLKRLRAFVSWR
jgi:hypothetical protein